MTARESQPPCAPAGAPSAATAGPGAVTTTAAGPAESTLDVRRRADDVIVDLWRRWRTGERVPVGEVLKQHPDLASDPQIRLDLIYAEYRIRRELGFQPDPDELLREHPDLAADLQRQLEVADWLSDDPAWPSLPAVAGSSMSAAASETIDLSGPPLTLDDFELQRRLGGGGMGELFVARQRSLDRLVAIKFLRAERGPAPHSQQRFLHEARAAAALRHPGIVAIYGVGVHLGRLFLVMELVDGTSLDARLRSGPLSIEESLRILSEMADAVAAMHRIGIIHRDLKPGNVLIGPEGRVQITDFGLSKSLHDDGVPVSLPGQVIGTPQYMAPEQADPRWGPITPASDVYGLGAVLFALLTGEAPAEAPSVGAILARVAIGDVERSPRRARPAVPLEVDELCARCLQANPDDRFPSADAFRAALEEVRRHLVTADASEQEAALPNRREHGWPALSPLTRVLTTAALVGIAALAVYLLGSPGAELAEPDAPKQFAVLGAGDKSAPRLIARADVTWSVVVYRQSHPATPEPLSSASPPLKSGDALRLDLQFPANSYAELFWIGSDGSVEHLGSLMPGDTNREHRLQVPRQSGQVLPVTAPDGLELCVAIHSPRPLAAPADWMRRLHPPADLPSAPDGLALVACHGALLESPRDTAEIAGLSADVLTQLSQSARPVGRPREIPAPSLLDRLEAWRMTLQSDGVAISYLALLHADRPTASRR